MGISEIGGNTAETVTIQKSEYETLLNKALWLECLEDAGVDNWEGYDHACDLRRQYQKEEQNNA